VGPDVDEESEHVASRQTGQALWDQLVRLGLEISTRMSSQDRAVANARVATTELSRARVERDAVELYLAGHEEERLAATEGTDEADLPSRRQERA
jgi:hypothetical protein